MEAYFEIKRTNPFPYPQLKKMEAIATEDIPKVNIPKPSAPKTLEI